MKWLVIVRNLGLLLVVTSAAILLVAGWSCLQWILGDESEKAALRALMLTVAGGGIVGMACWFVGRRARQTVGRREAILLVATSWFVAAALSAVPYRLWAASSDAPVECAFGSYIDCYFEAMSGLTTTGATVLSNIEALPRSLHLWRSLTHWLGGLGIVVLFVAVLPMLGVGGKRLFRVESPGPTPEGVTPRIQETARVLWMIYLGLTVVEIFALRIVGLSWFESVCHTFATLATGGFSTLNPSVAGYQSVAVDTVLIVFMIAAGVNFGLYFQIIKGRWRTVTKDRELRSYLGFIAIGSALVVFSILNRPIVTTDGSIISQADFGDAVRYGVFQVVAVQTTTGFCTADFDLWPFLPKFAMLCLMFVGGSAGSTGGGIKVIRCMMAFKILWAELERVFHPNVVRPVKIGKAVIDTEMKLATMVYFVGIAVLTLLGMVALMLLESGKDIDSITALTASIATLNNIGPGLAKVGATCNFGWFTAGSKCVMILLMALGRLEVMTIIVLFFPRFWRGD